MPSIDTNILLRLLLGDIESQRQAVLHLLEKYDKIAISDLAITEMVFVLEKVLGVSRKQVAECIGSLLGNQHLVLNRPLLTSVLPYYQVHRAVSFNDCCLAVYAKLNNQTPLYTFDKKLAKQIPGTQLVDS